MSGGSHNRTSKTALSHVVASIGKKKLCKCPLHRNGGEGTLVPQIKFKRHTSAGVQGMCADGKTLIDSYSHQLKRLQLYIVAFPGELNEVFEGFDPKYAPLVANIKRIIRDVLRISKKTGQSESDYRLSLLTKMDQELKSARTGYYDIELAPSDKAAFKDALTHIFTRERINKVEKAQANWTKGGFVLDSKDKILYPVENFTFNFSKKREFYGTDKKLTPYRINVHNTIAKGQRSSTLRGERYLADGAYTEANRKMKAIGIADRKMHGDHFVPLALGGIHDVKNLRKLSGPENLNKRDKLTPQAFKAIKKDINLLSHWHHQAFLKHAGDGLEVTQAALKQSVYETLQNVLSMTETEKFDFIQGVYPAYKDSQIERIIRKHFTSYDDKSD